MKKAVSVFVLAMAFSFIFTNAFAADKDPSPQLKDLQKEALTLLAERQKHMDEVTRIETRLNEINIAMKGLTPKLAAVEAPKVSSGSKDSNETDIPPVEKKEVKNDQAWKL